MINNPSGNSMLADTGLISSAGVGTDVPADEWPDYEIAPSHFQWTPPQNRTGTASPPYYDVNDTNQRRRPMARHNGGLNVSYFDGHAKWNSIQAFLGPMPNGHPVGHPMNSWDNR